MYLFACCLQVQPPFTVANFVFAKKLPGSSFSSVEKEAGSRIGGLAIDL